METTNKASLAFAESMVKRFAAAAGCDVQQDKDDAGRIDYHENIEMRFWTAEEGKAGAVGGLVNYLNGFAEPADKRMAATYWVYRKMCELANEIGEAWDNA